METLSRTRESASSFMHQVASRFRSSHQGSADLLGWATPFWDAARDSIFRIAYVARGKLIEWCLALANYLQRAQANAIARAMSANGRGLPAGVTLPPPTFPNPNRRYSPAPREPSTSVLSLAIDPSSELKYEDFDDAPTEVYHSVPTEISGHAIPAKDQQSMKQSDERSLST